MLLQYDAPKREETLSWAGAVVRRASHWARQACRPEIVRREWLVRKMRLRDAFYIDGQTLSCLKER